LAENLVGDTPLRNKRKEIRIKTRPGPRRFWLCCFDSSSAPEAHPSLAENLVGDTPLRNKRKEIREKN
jgi:hypothetical protein